MAYGLDFLTGGTASMDYGFYPAANGFDDDTGTYYQNWNTVPCWCQYDLGEGISKVVAKYTIQLSIYPQYPPITWLFQVSNNGTDWTTLDSQSGISWGEAYEKKDFFVDNAIAYRWLRWYFTAQNTAICISEFEAMEITGPSIQAPANYLHGRRERLDVKGVSIQNNVPGI